MVVIISVGLINVSDYEYATSGTSDSTRNTCITSAMNSNNITSTCYDNNYLFIDDQNQWTINKSSQGNSITYITNVGKITRGTATGNYYYRPVVYLKSTVKINTETGNGSINSPYELE